MRIEVDASELVTLAEDIERMPAGVDRSGRVVVQQSATRLRDSWRNNARATAGAHGIHYPNSITFETKLMTGNAEAEVGPDSGKPQGGMGPGFEFGSVNQPPHLDGQRAAVSEEPVFERSVVEMVERLLR